jgi:hypothetical protein
MKHSRRVFLQTTSLAAASLPFASLLAPRAAADPAAGPPARKRGLLFDEDDLPRIRANIAGPRYAPYWQKLESADLADDTDFLEHHVRFNRHSDDMARVRLTLERTALVAFVTGDPRQLAVAKLAIRRLLDYPKWDMFLEGGKTVMGLLRAAETTLALAFSLDWLARHLSPAERAEIEQAIAEKGAPATATALTGMRHPERVKGWTFDPQEDYPLNHTNLSRWPLILNSTNLKTVPATGLGVAACLLHGRHPKASEWLELARTSMREFATMYGSDGCYDEGVSYWVPTTLDMAVFAEVLWRTLGIDDRALINYPGTIQYALTMTLPRFDGPAAPIAPRYDIVNFGDANGSVEISLAAWVARTRGDPVSQFLARDVGEVKYHYGLLWYDASAPAAQPDPALLDNRMLNDLVVSRSGWGEADGVVALRSGGPANHEHADRNSVIFKAHGDRLLHDPFEAAYAAFLERWKLRFTDAHTAVLIDGKGHQYIDGRDGTNASDSFARVTAFETGPGWMRATSDATDAYQLVNAAVGRVERTVVFIKPDILLFLDRVEMRETPATVQARFQVFNEDGLGSCSAAGTSFRIKRPHACLHARVGARGAFTVGTGRVAISEKEGIFPFAEVSAGPALSHLVLTACTAAPAGEDHGSLVLAGEGPTWRIQGEHRGRRLNVTLTAGTDGPPSITL